MLEPLLGVDDEALEDPLARAVVRDQLPHVVALGGRVLGVGADVRYSRDPLRRNTFDDRPHATTLRNRYLRDLT